MIFFASIFAAISFIMVHDVQACLPHNIVFLRNAFSTSNQQSTVTRSQSTPVNAPRSFWPFSCTKEPVSQITEVYAPVKTVQQLTLASFIAMIESSSDIEDFTHKIDAQHFDFLTLPGKEMQEERDQLARTIASYKEQVLLKDLPKDSHLLLRANDKQVEEMILLSKRLHIDIPFRKKLCRERELRYYSRTHSQESFLYYDGCSAKLGKIFNRLNLFDQEQAYHNHVKGLQNERLALYKGFACDNDEESLHRKYLDLCAFRLDKQNIELAKLQKRVQDKTQSFADSEFVVSETCRKHLKDPEDYKKFEEYINQHIKLTERGLNADLQFYKKREDELRNLGVSYHEKYPYSSTDGLSRYSPSAQCIVPAIMSGKIKIQK